jgi:hypothetical protein
MSYNAQQALQENDAKLRHWNDQLNAVDKFDKPMMYEGCVTGLSHYQYTKVVDIIKTGTQLLPAPDTANPYDPNAIALQMLDKDNIERPIGWIPKALNVIAAKALRKGHTLKAVVTKHAPNDDFKRKLFVEVFIDKGVKTDANRCITDYIPTQPSIKEPSMATKSVNQIVEQNITLGASAAFLEAGRIANVQLSSIASKKLPIMVRAYADTALGRLLLANIALMARDHFRPNDERLGKLVNAMTVSAYQEVLQTFDVEAMIDDMISNSTIKRALSKFDNDSEETPPTKKGK